MKRVIQSGVFFAGMFFLLSSVAVAKPDSAKMQELMEKLEMLNALDFQNALEAAQSCTAKRDFDCSREKIEEAGRWASNPGQKQRLTLIREELETEKALVALEKEERALKERLRRERIAEEKRQREWQEEQRRRRELAEQRAREKREKQQAIGMAIGLAAGYAAVSNGADSELAEQVFDQTSTGAYAVMSGDQEAAREYQRLKSDMEQNLDEFRVRQEVLRRKQAERRRQHQAIIDRAEAHRRANEHKPVYATKHQMQQGQLTRAVGASSGQDVQAKNRREAEQRARMERAREREAYVAEKMARVDAARQKVAAQSGGQALKLSVQGSPNGSGGKLTSLSGYEFELARYEPPETGFVIENIVLKGNCFPDVARNADGARFVKCGLRLNHDFRVAGYKYKGQIYPKRPPVDGAEQPWLVHGIRVSGNIREGRTVMDSFDAEFISTSYAGELVEFEASHDRFNKADFEFRDMEVVPLVSAGNNRVIESYLGNMR